MSSQIEAGFQDPSTGERRLQADHRVDYTTPAAQEYLERQAQAAQQHQQEQLGGQAAAMTVELAPAETPEQKIAA